MTHGTGVVEVIRTYDGKTPTRRIRHRRKGRATSWWVAIACGDGEGIIAPFDDTAVTLCRECWGDR